MLFFCEVKIMEKRLKLKNNPAVICYLEMLQNDLLEE